MSEARQRQRITKMFGESDSRKKPFILREAITLPLCFAVLIAIVVSYYCMKSTSWHNAMADEAGSNQRSPTSVDLQTDQRWCTCKYTSFSVCARLKTSIHAVCF